jgi:hypothetical protein
MTNPRGSQACAQRASALTHIQHCPAALRPFHSNIAYNPTNHLSQGAFLGLTFSDQFKPSHLASFRGIKFVNVSQNATIVNPLRKTGSWRYFNYYDTDGSIMGRGRPTLIASHSAVNDTGPSAIAAPFQWWLSDASCVTSTSMG